MCAFLPRSTRKRDATDCPPPHSPMAFRQLVKTMCPPAYHVVIPADTKRLIWDQAGTDPWPVPEFSLKKAHYLVEEPLTYRRVADMVNE